MKALESQSNFRKPVCNVYTVIIRSKATQTFIRMPEAIANGRKLVGIGFQQDTLVKFMYQV